MNLAYEQKPKTWSLFPMSEEDAQKKRDFFYDKGWDEEKAPTHSGKLMLEDGTIVRLEGRFIKGDRGEFISGSCYIPQGQGGGSRSDDSRGRGRDDRGSADRDRGRGGADNRPDDRSRGGDRQRDDRGGGRDSGRDDRGSSRGSRGDYDDDVPF